MTDGRTLRILDESDWVPGDTLDERQVPIIYACGHCQVAWSNKSPNPTKCHCGREGYKQ